MPYTTQSYACTTFTGLLGANLGLITPVDTPLDLSLQTCILLKPMSVTGRQWGCCTLSVAAGTAVCDTPVAVLPVVQVFGAWAGSARQNWPSRSAGAAAYFNLGCFPVNRDIICYIPVPGRTSSESPATCAQRLFSGHVVISQHRCCFFRPADTVVACIIQGTKQQQPYAFHNIRIRSRATAA